MATDIGTGIKSWLTNEETKKDLHNLGKFVDIAILMTIGYGILWLINILS